MSINVKLARVFLGHPLHASYRAQLSFFHTEFKLHGSYYLLFLRLLPFIPFVLVNLFVGVMISISFETFLWTTIVGMMPLTCLHISAGQKLQMITSAHDIFSWQAILLIAVLLSITLIMFFKKRFSKHKNYEL